MRGTIPADPTHCTHCIAPESFGLTASCKYHRGEDGEPTEYTGEDAYVPGEWALQVIGNRYKGTYGRIYICFGYDPRSGYWMRTDDGGELRETNISERAIDRTFHRVYPDDYFGSPGKST